MRTHTKEIIDANTKKLHQTILTGVIIGALLVLVLVFIFSSQSGQTGRVAAAVYKAPVYETITDTIVKGVISVNAGSYQNYAFTIPNDATVTGSFFASGGSGNDISIYIMSPTDFINWKNGHSFSVYYQSGKTTTGSIGTTLTSGNYYIVYDNRFSALSSKSVDTTVSYSYQVCVKNCA